MGERRKYKDHDWKDASKMTGIEKRPDAVKRRIGQVVGYGQEIRSIKLGNLKPQHIRTHDLVSVLYLTYQVVLLPCTRQESLLAQAIKLIILLAPSLLSVLSIYEMSTHTHDPKRARVRRVGIWQASRD